MSATERPIATLPERMVRIRSGWRTWVGGAVLIAVAAGAGALAHRARGIDARVGSLLKARLPKTPLTRVDCGRIEGLCEVLAGANLFYVDRGGRYLVIGRVYDMETRQDLTAARLLEINPDLLIGGAARRAIAGGSSEAGSSAGWGQDDRAQARPPVAPPPRYLSLAGLPSDGAIVWGESAGPTVTVFSDFRCGYCRALTAVLQTMRVRVVERPISVLGSRAIAEQVYCAKDRRRALQAAYATRPIAAAPPCDTSGLDANERFARAHGLSGTPVIVRSDGALLEGYRPKDFLMQWIGSAKS